MFNIKSNIKEEDRIYLEASCGIRSGDTVSEAFTKIRNTIEGLSEEIFLMRESGVVVVR